MKNILLTPIFAVALTAMAATPLVFADPISPVPAEKAAPATSEESAALDGKFIDHAARGGLAEIKFSEEVDGRVTRDDVKQFAKMMIADHTDVNKNLKTLTDRMNIKLPSELTTEAQVTLDKLKAAANKDIDQMYIDVMVKDHQKVVALFEERAKNSQNADIKAFAQNTLPGLKQHLMKAEALQKSFNVAANPPAL